MSVVCAFYDWLTGLDVPSILSFVFTVAASTFVIDALLALHLAWPIHEIEYSDPGEEWFDKKLVPFVLKYSLWSTAAVVFAGFALCLGALDLMPHALALALAGLLVVAVYTLPKKLLES